mmetsp:Transcript_21625/g.47503  ORF Transcript_21625/g.47503 Transcript_21625/m.47503 type:complete len:300 (-) Transcript_21625:73-972(-)
MDIVNNVFDPRLVRTGAKCTDAAEARERAYEESLKEDLTAEWVLPIGVHPEQSLRTDKIESMATIDKALAPQNKGYQMLLRMGWKEGGGLGPNQKGITEPVRGGLDRWDRAGGVGKQEQDEHYTNEENIERRKLAIEVEETEEDRAKRETVLEKETRVKEAVKQMVDVFKCQLCNKQYKNVMEYEQHLSSYDHHHKKRLMEMKDTMRESREDIIKRDQRRVEKEMEKFNQLFQAKQAAGGSALVAPTAPEPTALPSVEGRTAIKMGFGGKKQKGGLFGAKKQKIKQAVAAFQLDSDDEA